VKRQRGGVCFLFVGGQEWLGVELLDSRGWRGGGGGGGGKGGWGVKCSCCL